MQLVLNSTTDLCILCIPISVVLNTSIGMVKKLMLMAVFSLGIFVITTAALGKYAVFTHPAHTMWIRWTVRELSAAMLVGNLIVCFPLMRRVWYSLGGNRLISSVSSPTSSLKLKLRTFTSSTSTSHSQD